MRFSTFASGYASRCRCCWCCGVSRSWASASSSWRPSPGSPSCLTDRDQRERALGYTQAFSSIGGLLVAGANWFAIHYAKKLRRRFRGPQLDVRHDQRSARRLAVHAFVRPDSGDPADRDPAVPAGVAGLAGETEGRNVASAVDSRGLRPAFRRTTIVNDADVCLAVSARRSGPSSRCRKSSPA